MDCVVLPGIGGSGADHWQSRWEAAEVGMTRFAPSSWDAPDLDDWLGALDRAVDAAGQPFGGAGGPGAGGAEAADGVVLVAHSLGCLAAAHWLAAAGQRPGPRARVAGAFLVAPPDVDGPAFPAAASTFRAPVGRALGVPALVVTSLDDRYNTPAAAAALARSWGAATVSAGAVGHVNSDSGLGSWPAGRALLTAFTAGLR